MEMKHNWRSIEDYPPSKTTSRNRWATEFLLRNAEFRKAIAGISKLEGPKNDPKSPYRKRWREIADQFGISHPILKGWGGDAPLAFKRPPYFANERAFPGVAGLWKVARSELWSEVLIFDLQQSLSKQLRTAASFLKSCRESKGVKALRGTQRDRKPNFVAMLRILDAIESGAKLKEITKTLYPQQDETSAIELVKKLKKRALEIRNGGYRYIQGHGFRENK